MSNCSNFENSKEVITIGDYEIKKTLGMGTFGKVKLVLFRPSNELRAVKILNKAQIEQRKEVHLVRRELNALKKLSHIVSSIS